MNKIFPDPRLPDSSRESGYIKLLVATLYDRFRSVANAINELIDSYADVSTKVSKSGDSMTGILYSTDHIIIDKAYLRKITVTTQNTSTTITIAQILGGIFVGTPTGSVTYTLPTGTLMDGAFTSLAVGQGFEWSVINAATSHSISLGAGTNHTIVGTALVSQEKSATFCSVKSATNTFVTYRVDS